jgi:hypothetical protein
MYYSYRASREVARRNNVSQAVLKEWGRKAKSAFQLRNRGAERHVSGNTVAERVEAKMELVLDQMENLKRTADSTEDKIGHIPVKHHHELYLCFFFCYH